ncbi:hypothetical protein ACE6H2_017076 [Prunus campanulata]
MSVLPNPPKKGRLMSSLQGRKVDVKSSRNEATTSRVKDVSPLMKRPRIPFTEKTQVRVGPSSSARVKYSSTTSSADPKVDKCSPAGDVGMSDLLKTNFLSSPSTYVVLVHQIR